MSALARASKPSSAGSSTSRSTDGRSEGFTEGQRREHGRPQFPVRAGQDGTRPAVVRPRAEQAFGAGRLVGGVRGQDQRARGIGSRTDDLREAFAVVLDQPDRPFDDRDRAAMVHLQVDAPEARKRRIESEDPAHVGQAPTVDRLVVVAHEEDPIRRRREQERQTQLRAVDVLDLVDEQMGAAVAPPREQGRIVVESVQRAPDQVVEVQTAALRDRSLVGNEGPRERAGVGVGGDRAPPSRRGRA